MSAERDLALLRRFEPVMRFTRGEHFFPMAVERYVNAASLWLQRAEQPATCLVPFGSMTLDHLADPWPEDGVLYLKRSDPLTVAELADFHRQERQAEKKAGATFRAGQGRLARVGYTSRLVDALFSLGLLARGRVPGDTAAAAASAYRRGFDGAPIFTYYGRVVRQESWTVLQYWYFYPYNDWRTSFFGANDHEADWEMVCIYLAEPPDGMLVPEWIAYASHDYAGDSLRRRWDDPEVVKVDEHPVIHVGAGSHANYFQPGEYLTEVELPFLAPLVRLVDRLQGAWRQRLRQYAGDRPPTGPGFNYFRVPFVDYARGDGLSIGPEQERPWSAPVLLDPPPPWVTAYRGLWGLYTRDPFASEDAPAGPMYTRAGTVRRGWYDPVGWAGLDATPPTHAALTRAEEQVAALATRQVTLRAEIARLSHEIQHLGVETAAMRGLTHLRGPAIAQRQQIASLARQLDRHQAELAGLDARRAALAAYAARLRAGERGPARAHLVRAHRPASDADLRLRRLADMWAATSVSLILVVVVVLIAFYRQYLVFGLAAAVALFFFIEASFRGRLVNLLTGLTLGLATLAALVLLYEFFWPVVVALVLLTGAYMLWENLRELWT